MSDKKTNYLLVERAFLQPYLLQSEFSNKENFRELRRMKITMQKKKTKQYLVKMTTKKNKRCGNANKE